MHIRINNIVVVYFIPLFSIPFLLLLISNIYLNIIFAILAYIYLFYFREQLVRSWAFWLIYYIFLSSQYIWIGYCGNDPSSISVAKIIVAFFQFLPLIIFFSLLLQKQNLMKLKKFKFTIVYFIYLISVLTMHNNFSIEGAVFLRNFSIFAISFFIGIFLSKYISVSTFFKYIIVVTFIYVLFGFFEQSQGWLFWRDYFNSYFVTELKNAGVSKYGMIGNKTTSILGEVYLRMTSVYYEPHHLSLTLSYFIFLLYSFKKTKLLKINNLVFFILITYFLLALIFTLVKAGYGFLVLSVIWITLLKKFKISQKKNKKFYFFRLLLYNIVVVVLLVFVLLNIGLGSTANTHLEAALAVFKLINPTLLLFGAANEFNALNSDSGFATIIFGIGFIGYMLFLIMLAEMLSYLDHSTDHPIKYYLMALVFAWFGTTHLVSSTWSPMVSFLLFFLIGLSSNIKQKGYCLYEKNLINK